MGIMMILAVSLNLVIGYTGQFSLGHAGFMSIGAYTSAVLSLHLPLENPFLVFWGFLGILVVAGIIAAFSGFLVGLPSLRLRGDTIAFSTLGFGEIIRVLLQNQNTIGGARGLGGIPHYTSLFWAFGIVALCIFVVETLIKSPYGKAFIAVRDDEIAAQSIGLSPIRFKLIAFVTSAFFAGLAGALYAHSVTFITPTQFGFIRSIDIVIVVIVGGLANTPGIIISAILLTLLPELLRSADAFRELFFAALLISTVFLRPRRASH